MEINAKEGFVSYGMVVDDMSSPIYYKGYFKDVIPQNTYDYTKAMKVPFKDEAQFICDIVNAQGTPFKYHVEEHAYM